MASRSELNIGLENGFKNGRLRIESTSSNMKQDIGSPEGHGQTEITKTHAYFSLFIVNPFNTFYIFLF